MDRYTTSLVGIFLMLGAAVGFTFGLVLTDMTWAAVYGAAGAGIGLVVGAVMAVLTRRPAGHT